MAGLFLENARLRLSNYFIHQRQVVAQLRLSHQHGQQVSGLGFEVLCLKFLQRFAGLPSHLASQSQQLAIAVFQAIAAGFGKGLGRAANFQHPVFGGTRVVDDLQRTSRTARGNAFQGARHHPERVG